MKKWICCILVLALMLLPTCASAMSFNFGLKEKRSDAPLAPTEEPLAPTEAPFIPTEAPAAEPEAPKLGFKVATPAPGVSVYDLDLTKLSDDELYELINRVYEELDARAPEPTPMPSIEDGLMLLDRGGVRLAVFDSDFDASNSRLVFYVIVENKTGKAISISINDPYVDGILMDGLGVYGVEDGATVSDYFQIEPIEGEESLYGGNLENAREISFSFEVWEDETYETMFFQPVTLTAE